MLEAFKIDLAFYEISRKHWIEFDTNKREFKSYLDHSIPRTYVDQMNNEDWTLALWVDFITLQLRPLNENRRIQLTAEHQRLMRGPKSDYLAGFLLEWRRFENRVTRYNHPVKEHLHFDFCRMVENYIDLYEGRLVAKLTKTLDEAMQELREFIEREPAKLKKFGSNSTVATGGY